MIDRPNRRMWLAASGALVAATSFAGLQPVRDRSAPDACCVQLLPVDLSMLEPHHASDFGGNAALQFAELAAQAQHIGVVGAETAEHRLQLPVERSLLHAKLYHAGRDCCLRGRAGVTACGIQPSFGRRKIAAKEIGVGQRRQRKRLVQNSVHFGVAPGIGRVHAFTPPRRGWPPAATAPFL